MKRFSQTLTILAAAAMGCGRQAEQAEFRFISASAHHHLDPQKVSWSHDIRIMECLFEPLVRVSPTDLAIEPGAAGNWQVSDDRMTYTFHLRPDARWSNGDPLTASDFIYAWRRALLPDLAADYTQLLFCIAGAEAFFTWRGQQLGRYQNAPTNQSPDAAGRLWDKTRQRFDATVGLSAPDDHTLVVRLAQPTPYFLQLCAFVTFMPVHAQSVERSVTINVQTGMLTQDAMWNRPGQLVGNGPYVLKEWRFKRSLLLVANPHYHDLVSMGNHSIQEIIVANPQTALLKYDRGEADWLPDIPTTKPIAADLIRSGRPDVHTVAAAGTYFYNFNCKPRLADGSVNPLSDWRVRRALSMAIDRRVIVDKVTRLGHVQPVAVTFVPPGTLPGYEPPTDEGVRFDPQGARTLLAQAGYRNGKVLSGLSILYNTEGGHEAIAQQIRRCWETHLNVVVKLDSAESKHFSQRLKNQDYTICRAGWFGDYSDATTFLDKFMTGNGNNDCAWSHDRYDALVRLAAVQTDPHKRAGLLRQAEALMLAQQPIAPIYHYIHLWLYNPNRIHGLDINAWNIRRLEHVRVTDHPASRRSARPRRPGLVRAGRLR